MLVRDWMSEEVITIEEDTSLMEASQIIREKRINQLPVLDKKGKLIGVVSDRDIKAASPSKATTLDVHELYYLLAKIKISEVMTKNPITIGLEDSVERAAVIMLERKISGMPVVDESGKVVGALTEGDVFRVLTSITGVYHGGIKFVFELDDRAGSIKEVADIIRKHGGRMNSILTSYDTAPEGSRTVSFRVLGLDEEAENALSDELGKTFKLKYWRRNELQSV